MPRSLMLLLLLLLFSEVKRDTAQDEEQGPEFHLPFNRRELQSQRGKPAAMVLPLPPGPAVGRLNGHSSKLGLAQQGL